MALAEQQMGAAWRTSQSVSRSDAERLVAASLLLPKNPQQIAQLVCTTLLRHTTHFSLLGGLVYHSPASGPCTNRPPGWPCRPGAATLLPPLPQWQVAEGRRNWHAAKHIGKHVWGSNRNLCCYAKEAERKLLLSECCRFSQ